GDWGKPKNIGTNINTRYDDDSPYLTKDGRTMYFSSRGHNTMGGYDIFVTKFDTIAKKWSKPENMGVPINTPDDDTYYRLSPDGSYAYLSSYRIGGYGEKDIYTINYIRNVTVKGHVYSMRDSTIIPGVELIFSGTRADKKVVSYRDVTKPDSGTYSVNLLSGRTYQVEVSKDGKQITTEQFEVPVITVEDSVIEKDFYVPFVDSTAIARFTFQNLYYDTDKSKLRPESIDELKQILKIMKDNPDLALSIEGHTDSRASDEYNMRLGRRRADSAYDYLVKNGISPKRLVTVTYGEKRPAVPNDSPENMQLNRRTEFKILPRQDQEQNQNQNQNQGGMNQNKNRR
ncbi:MAG: OmpA family protein, partial [Hymenobacteraceae bacterium]|nr:OmpA family protein [Hymenobacteraceae bacterium]